MGKDRERGKEGEKKDRGNRRERRGKERRGKGRKGKGRREAKSCIVVTKCSKPTSILYMHMVLSLEPDRR